jgi:hypothetical protein
MVSQSTGPARGASRPSTRAADMSPTGYRIDAGRRLDLQAAMLALGKDSLQAVIDHAVAEFLTRMEGDAQYRQIARAARRAKRRRAADS